MDPCIERATEAFDAHDADRLMEEMAAGSTFTDPLEEEITGTELQDYTVEIFEAFPDVRLDVGQVFTSNEGVQSIEGRYVGTHEGPLDDIPPTGNSVAVPTTTVIDVSDDGITSWRDHRDQQTFAKQLGLEYPEILPLVPKTLVRKIKGTL